MLALTKDDIRQTVSMRDAIDLVKLAFRELSDGNAIVPLRNKQLVEPRVDRLVAELAQRHLGFDVQARLAPARVGAGG